MDNSYYCSLFPPTTTTTAVAAATGASIETFGGTTTTTATNNTNMGWLQNSANSFSSSSFIPIAPAPPQPNSHHHFHHLPSQLQLFQQHKQFPQPYSVVATAAAYPAYPYNFPGRNDGIPCSNKPKVPVDPMETKAARSKRILARQSQRSQRNNSLSASSNQVTGKRLNNGPGAETSITDNKTDQYKFCTPDNKRLRVLLMKILKNSDVGSLGRIVLPKREAEANLPTLYDKEGIHFVIKHVYANQAWTLRYKFWINNKSRMYVLENTGHFVKHNRLEIGDSLTLYGDESNNLYFSILKAGMDADEGSYNQHYNNVNINNGNNMNNITDMQFANLSREQLEPNNIMSLPMDAAVAAADGLPDEAEQFIIPNSAGGKETYSEITPTTTENSSTDLETTTATAAAAATTTRSADDRNFDDCYGGLDMLPGFRYYNFTF